MKRPQLQVNIQDMPVVGDTFTINGITLTYNEKGIIITAEQELTGTETFTSARNNMEAI